MTITKVVSVEVLEPRPGQTGEYEVKIRFAQSYEQPGENAEPPIYLSPEAARELRNKLANLGGSINAYRRRQSLKEK